MVSSTRSFKWSPEAFGFIWTSLSGSPVAAEEDNQLNLFSLSSLCLSFRLLAEGAYERAGDPSEGLRGSLRFNPIVFQRQPPGGKQRKHRQPILSQTVYRLRGCLRITVCCVRSPVQEMSIHWFSQESDLAEFPFHVRSWGSGKLVGQTNKMPCNYFKLLDTNSKLCIWNLRDSLAASQRDSLLVHTDIGHNTAETRRPGSLPWPVIHKIRKTSGIISALCRGGDLSGTKEKKWGWESSRTHRPTTLLVGCYCQSPDVPS